MKLLDIESKPGNWRCLAESLESILSIISMLEIFSLILENKLSCHLYIYCFNWALDIISIQEPIFRALDCKTRRGLLGHHNSIKEASKTW